MNRLHGENVSTMNISKENKRLNIGQSNLHDLKEMLLQLDPNESIFNLNDLNSTQNESSNTMAQMNDDPKSTRENPGSSATSTAKSEGAKKSSKKKVPAISQASRRKEK
jgi:hypothetical protein